MRPLAVSDPGRRARDDAVAATPPRNVALLGTFGATSQRRRGEVGGSPPAKVIAASPATSAASTMSLETMEVQWPIAWSSAGTSEDLGRRAAIDAQVVRCPHCVPRGLAEDPPRQRPHFGRSQSGP
jgi:hypothetical protein